MVTADVLAYRREVTATVDRLSGLLGPDTWDCARRQPPVRQALAALGEAGLLTPVIPSSRKRSAESLAYSAVLHETLAPYPVGAAVLTHVEVGSRLIAAHLPSEPVLELARRGRHLPALAVTEPAGGLDFDAMSTTLTPVSGASNGAFEIDGEKWFCSNSPFADELIVLTRDGRFGPDSAGRHTLVRVPREAPGVTVEALNTFGHRGLTGHVRLDGVLLDERSLLGTPGGGLVVLMRHWVHERVMLAVRMTAMADWLLSLPELAAVRGHETVLTDLAMEVTQERAAYHRAWRRMAADACDFREAAGCKLRAGRLLRRTADAVLLVQGLAGADTYPVDRVLRDALGLALAGGSEEALLMQIARSLT
ncbi:acyl-CoA dehydrogenase family protein [Streptomyces sp. NPDC050538]|uniref:acyl-CoA dehydrogenase family protein n=1 Tax=Streptomyces sp. NPDC050538 TaxID=3365627 RepID=UPI0037AA9F07